MIRTMGGPSLAARLAHAAIRNTVRPAVEMGALLPVPFALPEFVAGPLRGGSTVELRNCTAQWLDNGSDRAILYVHGGGFLSCGSATHAHIIRALSKTAKASVLAVDYRLLPSPLSMATRDCLDGLDWLLERFDPEQVVVAGDSAGGYLSLRIARHCPGLAGVALMSPLLELDSAGRLRHPNIRTDALFGPRAFARMDCELIHPRQELVDMDGWDGFPPVLIHVSGSEVMLHDAVKFNWALSGRGVKVDVVVWPGQVHVFQGVTPFVPEAASSLHAIGSFVTDVTRNSGCNTPINEASYRTCTVG